MSCKQKQKALNEAAACGSELSAELREHIGACLDCRAAFAEEVALLAAIDSRVRQSVNAEPSPAFLLGVRARLASDAVRDRHPIPVWKFASATVSVALLLFLVGDTLRHPTNRTPAEELVRTVRPDVTPARSQAMHSVPALTGRGARVTAPDRPKLQSVHGKKDELEVIVSPGEEALVLRFYENAWISPERVAAALPEPSDTALRPRSIAPLEIAKLKIDALVAPPDDFTR